MATYKHGIYVHEQATSLTPPIEGTAGLQVIVGTAPVNRAEDLSTVLEPKLIYTDAEAVAALGHTSDWEKWGKYTLCQSVDACFSVFNIAPLILINVLDPAKHKKDNTEEEVAVANGLATYAKEGVLLNSVKVTNSTGVTTYVRDKDYSLAFNDADTVDITLLEGGEAAAESTIKVSSTSIDPNAVTEADVVGGLDAATGKETGISAVRQVYPRFGLTTGLLLAPGWSHKSVVAAALQAKTEQLNGVYRCETLLDLDCGADGARKYGDVMEAKTAAGATNAHAAALWPMLAVGAKRYRFSALFGALIAYTDASNGDVPDLSPSNKAIRATSVVLEDGTPVLLDQEQANFVNSLGVITALPISGAIKAWGNNTAAYPTTTDPKDRWLCVRRFFSWWGNSFIMSYFQKVDSPANARLIENLCDSENIRGNGYVATGKCAGARIEYREAENTITDIMGGVLTFHQMLAPYTPVEVINDTLEFDPSALEAEMSGVAS